MKLACNALKGSDIFFPWPITVEHVTFILNIKRSFENYSFKIETGTFSTIRSKTLLRSGLNVHRRSVIQR
jgi:hypothetical protein